jgi:hypothetical protein
MCADYEFPKTGISPIGNLEALGRDGHGSISSGWFGGVSR